MTQVLGHILASYKLYFNFALAYKKLVTLATQLMLKQSVPIRVNV